MPSAHTRRWEVAVPGGSDMFGDESRPRPPAGEGLLLILTPLYAVAAAGGYGRPTTFDAV